VGASDQPRDELVHVLVYYIVMRPLARIPQLESVGNELAGPEDHEPFSPRQLVRGDPDQVEIPELCECAPQRGIMGSPPPNAEEPALRALFSLSSVAA
jgi:hypothetical protein